MSTLMFVSIVISPKAWKKNISSGFILPFQLIPPRFFTFNDQLLCIGDVRTDRKFLELYTLQYSDKLQTGQGQWQIFFKLGKLNKFRPSSLTNGSRCFISSRPSPSLLVCIISSSAEQSSTTRESKFGTKMSQVKSFNLWQCLIVTRQSFWKQLPTVIIQC